MDMERVSLVSFVSAADSLRSRYRRPLTNIFMNRDDLQNLLERKICFMRAAGQSLFLLAPYHDYYYDFLYLSANKAALETDLKDFLGQYNLGRPLRASIIGQEPMAMDNAEIFEQSGFRLYKKLARMRAQEIPNEVIEYLRSLQKNMETLESDERSAEFCGPQFAESGEEYKILNLLLEEFDILADSLPELDKIAKNIEKKQIIVIKKDDDIVALKYFVINNGLCHGIYDVVQKKFRDKMIFLYMIEKFLTPYLIEKNLNRIYSWRDYNNKRHMRHASLVGEKTDGIFIYNLVYKNEL